MSGVDLSGNQRQQGYNVNYHPRTMGNFQATEQFFPCPECQKRPLTNKPSCMTMGREQYRDHFVTYMYMENMFHWGFANGASYEQVF